MYLKLVRPSCEYEEQVMQYKEDMLANNDSFDGCAGLEGRCRIDKKNCLVVLRKRKPCMRSNIVKKIEEIIRNTTEEEQEKVDWTKAWSTKYPVLATYQKEVDIPKYAAKIRRMFTELQEDYNYSEQDAMLVLKDILAHEYMDNRPKKNKKHK